MTRYGWAKIRHVGWAVIAAAAFFGTLSQSAAQQVPDLGTLLRLPVGTQGGANLLDLSRDAAARGNATSPLTNRQGTQQDPNQQQQRSTIALTEQQRFVARQFCETGKKLDELPANFSALEQDYCRRAGELLLQYGYDNFDATRAPDVLVNGAIPDTYRLGIGDEIVVTLRGQVSATSRPVIDREGRIVLDNLPPLPAAGRTFGDFRRELQARVQAAFLGTDVFVSLGSVRLIAVAVVGEVAIPGVHQLTGLSTVLDALTLAGGVKKTGTLRSILVERRDGVLRLDLYDLIMAAGRGVDLTLSEGDRIVVPTLGATLAVAGKVKRPGIYEIAPGATGISVQDVIALGGGSLRPIGNRVVVRAFDTSGREVVRQAEPSERIGEGSLVLVEYADDIEVGTVRIDGAVRVAGTRVRAGAPSVRTLIGGPESLVPGAYLPFAILETVEPATLARRYFAINLQRVLSGQEDFTLRDRDRLLVMSEQDVRFLSTERVQSVIRPIGVERGLQAERAPEAAFLTAQGQNQRAVPNATAAQAAQRGPVMPLAGQQANQQQVAQGNAPTVATPGAITTQRDDDAARFVLDECRGIDVLQGIVDRTRSSRFAGAVQPVPVTAVVRGDTRPVECPGIYNDNPELLAFVLEHVVSIVGEVRVPGAYPATPRTAIGVIVAVAGGVTLDADLTRVEFTQTDIAARAGTSNTTRALADLSVQQGATIPVSPGDIVRFNAIRSDRDTGPILLAGEFARPGYYDIRRGERLSDVVARAGGLTAQAYPYGAVFTRERVKRAEQEGLDRAVRDLNSALAAALTRGEFQQGGVLELQALAQQAAATETIGRVVIEADPTVLQVRPELDVVLEPGDVLYMPKRPATVLVTGDVLNPTALQFVPGTSVETYIRQAGGLQRSADRDRLFILYPNGVAQPVSLGGAWTFGGTVQIPPGSAIVAPKDASRFGLGTVRDWTTLVGQIALTAASLAVIAR